MELVETEAASAGAEAQDRVAQHPPLPLLPLLLNPGSVSPRSSSGSRGEQVSTTTVTPFSDAKFDRLVAQILFVLIALVALTMLPHFLTTFLSPESWRDRFQAGLAWLSLTPHVRLAIFGAIGSVLACFFSKELIRRLKRESDRQRAWRLVCRANVGAVAGFLSGFMLQTVQSDLDAVNRPLAIICAFAAGFVGRPFFDTVVRRAWPGLDPDSPPPGERKEPNGH